MNPTQLDNNAKCIEHELNWFNSILEQWIKLHFEGVQTPEDLLELIPPPQLPHPDAPYAEIVHQFQLLPAERLVLILSVVPHLKPHLLTWTQNKEVLMEQWQLKQRLKPGFRSLFYGPPAQAKP